MKEAIRFQDWNRKCESSFTKRPHLIPGKRKVASAFFRWLVHFWTVDSITVLTEHFASDGSCGWRRSRFHNPSSSSGVFLAVVILKYGQSISKELIEREGAILSFPRIFEFSQSSRSSSDWSTRFCESSFIRLVRPIPSLQVMPIVGWMALVLITKRFMGGLGLALKDHQRPRTRSGLFTYRTTHAAYSAWKSAKLSSRLMIKLESFFFPSLARANRFRDNHQLSWLLYRLMSFDESAEPSFPKVTSPITQWTQDTFPSFPLV